MQSRLLQSMAHCSLPRRTHRHPASLHEGRQCIRHVDCSNAEWESSQSHSPFSLQRAWSGDCQASKTSGGQVQAAGLDGAKVACRHAVAWSDDNAHNALRSWKLLRSCGKARDLHHGKLLTAQSRQVRGMLSSTKASFVGATLSKIWVTFSMLVQVPHWHNYCRTPKVKKSSKLWHALPEPLCLVSLVGFEPAPHGFQRQAVRVQVAVDGDGPSCQPMSTLRISELYEPRFRSTWCGDTTGHARFVPATSMDDGVGACGTSMHD